MGNRGDIFLGMGCGVRVDVGIDPYEFYGRSQSTVVGGGVHDAPHQRAVGKRQPLQVLGKVACGVVGRPAHRPPSTYGSAPIDAAGG